ncbi:MAG: hypothetical protein ACPG4Z_01370 [Chitinophagales bacterium]
MDLQKDFLATQIIFFGLLMGVISFCGVTLFITDSPYFSIETTLFTWISIIMSMGSITASAFFFRSLTNKLTKEDDLIEKLNTYRTAKIISWAFIEGVMLFNIVIFFVIENNYLYLCILGLLLFVFLTKAPLKSKLLTEAKLTEEEIKML